MEVKKQFFAKIQGEGFVKVTEKPQAALTSEQKVLLNRKGNVLFNQGDINTARRIFLATGYSDGLTRVGDNYMKLGDELSALKMYWLAHNKNKLLPIIERTAHLISSTLHEEG